MTGHGNGSSGMWIMVAIGAIIVVLAIVFALKAATGATGRGSRTEETPLEILQKRYARGEITKEEFDAMKRDLGLY